MPVVWTILTVFLTAALGDLPAFGEEQLKLAPTTTDPNESLKLLPRELDTLKLEERQEIVSAIRSRKDNYCDDMLNTVEQGVFDRQGLAKLLAVKRECPSAVSLTETIKYVNTQLMCATDDPYNRVLSPKEAKALRERFAGTYKSFEEGGLGLEFHIDPANRLPDKPSQDLAVTGKITAPLAVAISPCTGKPVELTEKEKNEQAVLAKKAQMRFAFGDGRIHHVIAYGPAAKAGLRDGDVVMLVNDSDVSGLEHQYVLKERLRGPLLSKVKLRVKRGVEEFDVVITRGEVIGDNVWSRSLGKHVYAIVISDMAREGTAKQVLDEIEKIKRSDPLARFVYDVRGNPGGQFNEAILLSAFLIHDGVIVSRLERVPGDPSNPQYKRTTWTRAGRHVVVEVKDEATGNVLGTFNFKMLITSKDPLTGEIGSTQTEDIPFVGDQPSVILFDGGTYSAGEIVAAALGENYKGAKADESKDNKDKRQGAYSIGAPHSGGKFIGQIVLPGPLDTSIRLTLFQYYSPNGEWLGNGHNYKVGLKPTLVIEQPELAVPYTVSDAQLNAAVGFLLSTE